MGNYIEFEKLLGKTLTGVFGAHEGSVGVEFIDSEGGSWKLYHEQDCCESVDVVQVDGDVVDILGSPILLAEEVTINPSDDHESSTATFYKLSTIKGSVTIRWLGVSNGYYSEDVTVFYEPFSKEPVT